MKTIGIRGAITVDSNTTDSMKSAVVEILNEMMERNNLTTKELSHVIFSVTSDLDTAFPATFARQELGWNNVAMMCFNEMSVSNALKMCLRVMLVVNCKDDFVPQYIYLKGAKNLRA